MCGVAGKCVKHGSEKVLRPFVCKERRPASASRAPACVRFRAGRPTDRHPHRPTTAANYLTELSDPVSPNNRGPYRRVVTGADSSSKVVCVRPVRQQVRFLAIYRVFQLRADFLNERTDDSFFCGSVYVNADGISVPSSLFPEEIDLICKKKWSNSMITVRSR